MITFIRTATIAPDRIGEAMAFLHQVAKRAEESTEHQVTTSMQVGGKFGRIAQSTTHPNLAEFETAMAKLMGDPEYVKMLAAAAPLFLPNETHDELWQSM
jgi:hypothetical protein